jgi:hypothetical protein
MNQTEAERALSTYDDAAKNLPPENTNENVPDGTYNVTVFRVEFKATKMTGKPILAWEFVVLDGEHAGRHIFKNHVVASDDNASYLARDFKTCGITLEKTSQAAQHLEDLLDLKLQVQVKTSKAVDKDGNHYVNCYIQKRISGSDVAHPEPKITERNYDDDIAF